MSARPGVVYLVGAGPGDPGLMTARSLDLISSADAIVYDRLIPEGALDGAREDAKLIFAGKAPGDVAMTQDETNVELVELARGGSSVVRLKGGDPFLFGRGGEEAEFLRAADVEFEVVPGITAGIAATAYAGIPVTHRDSSPAVAFVTGHENPDKPSDGPVLDYEGLAKFPGTLVFYMGVKRLPAISASLIAAGRRPDEPAAVIQRGTFPDQRQVVSTLKDLPDLAKREGIRAPAIILVGDVATRREAIAWFDRRPLHGRRVIVTRARTQVSRTATSLRELGAEVIELPAIRIEPRIEAEGVGLTLAELRSFDLVCLTSPNSVRLLFEAMAAHGLDARALSGATVAAIGPGTTRDLETHGIRADIVPERSIAESLVDSLADLDLDGKRVLIARALEARNVLPDALTERGAKVEILPLYETVAALPDSEVVERASGADYVTFTSASTVNSLLDGLGDAFPTAARVVTIGPITSEAARERGLEVAVEAVDHNPEGLIDALVADAAGGPPQ